MASSDQNNPYGFAPPPTTPSGTSGSNLLFPDVPRGPSIRIGLGSEHPQPFSVNQYGTPYQGYQYVQGDEWGPGSDLGAIPQIQAEMIAAGLIKPSDVRVGVWDANSADAYKEVLGFAQSQGVSPTEALTILTSNPTLGSVKGGGGSGGSGRAPTSFANPADVQSQFRSTSQGLTGQEQDPAAFQSYYHGLEASAGASPGGTVAPSLGSAAEQYVLQNDPSQVQAYGVASRMADFLSMVGAK